MIGLVDRAPDRRDVARHAGRRFVVDDGDRFFPETGFTVPARFVAYWDAHGGLPIFGYPITAAVMENAPDTANPRTAATVRQGITLVKLRLTLLERMLSLSSTFSTSVIWTTSGGPYRV